MISVCIPVYKAHPAPNIAAIGDALAAALGEHAGELVVALNGIPPLAADVPSAASTVDLGVNRGVAPAWNAAARAAVGEVLMFCNDDVQLGARSLAVLADALERNPEAGVVGPVGARWEIAHGEARDRVRMDGRPAGELAECEAVSGFLFACRRETWECVGGFDERYAPASWEEIDFCTAVRAAGGRCYAVAGVQYEHEYGVSRRKPPWARARWDGRSETWRSVHRRNRRLFLSKWAKAPIAAAPLAAEVWR